MSFEIINNAGQVENTLESEQARIRAMFFKEVFFYSTVECEKKKHGLYNSMGSTCAFACKHVLDQDELHPIGIIFMPEYFFICKTCYNLLERKKFKKWTEIVTKCRACILEEIKRIVKINPELFKDYSQENIVINLLAREN